MAPPSRTEDQVGDDAVTTYIPELKGSAYDGVTIRQFLTMSSGVKWNEDYADPNADVARAGARVLEPGVNPIVSYMKALPRENAPGTKFHYDTGETDLAGILLSNAVGKSLSEYASEKLWQAYGMERDATWLTDMAGHERGAAAFDGLGRLCPRRPVRCSTAARRRERKSCPTAGSPRRRRRNHQRRATDRLRVFLVDRRGRLLPGVRHLRQSITVIPDDRLVIVINSAWPTAVGRDLFIARSAFLRAVTAASKGL